MKINIQSIFKNPKKALAFLLVALTLNVLSFGSANYAAATFPSNDLFSLFSPGFKDAKKSKDEFVYGSVRFQNNSKNYSLNKSIPYDDCYVLENTYSKDSNFTFLRIEGNQLIKPCIIETYGVQEEFPVFSFCINDYFDLDYVTSPSSFLDVNRLLIPSSLADKIGYNNVSPNSSIEIISKRNGEEIKKTLKISGVYEENEKSLFMKNIAGQYPVIVSRNTLIPGTPSIYYKATTDSYLYFNVYAKKVYNSILVDRYEKEGNYGAKYVEFYTKDFSSKKENVNSIITKRENFISKSSRYAFMVASLISFVLFMTGFFLLQMLLIKKYNICRKKTLCLSLISCLFPILVFSIINIFCEIFPFGANLQLLNGVGILTYLALHAIFIILLLYIYKRHNYDKNLIN